MLRDRNFWWGVGVAVVGMWAWNRFGQPMMTRKVNGR